MTNDDLKQHLKASLVSIGPQLSAFDLGYAQGLKDGVEIERKKHSCLTRPTIAPLTDEEIYEMYNEPRSDSEMLAFARAIEAAHGITKGQK